MKKVLIALVLLAVANSAFAAMATIVIEPTIIAGDPDYTEALIWLRADGATNAGIAFFGITFTPEASDWGVALNPWLSHPDDVYTTNVGPIAMRPRSPRGFNVTAGGPNELVAGQGPDPNPPLYGVGIIPDLVIPGGYNPSGIWMDEIPINDERGWCNIGTVWSSSATPSMTDKYWWIDFSTSQINVYDLAENGSQIQLVGDTPDIDVIIIPEPTTLLLLGASSLLIALRRR